jgi:crossover junction endodeoxyribonuclease RusA
VISVTLPWPPSQLSPNARIHWGEKSRYRKLYRDACYWQTIASGIKPNVAYRPPLMVAIEFVPPDRRARDLDNMLGAIKSGLDGLADAIGVDDKHWALSLCVSPHIGGMVKVAITEAA